MPTPINIREAEAELTVDVSCECAEEASGDQVWDLLINIRGTRSDSSNPSQVSVAIGTDVRQPRSATATLEANFKAIGDYHGAALSSGAGGGGVQAGINVPGSVTVKAPRVQESWNYVCEED